MSDFGPRLKALRMAKGMDRKQLATAIGSSPAYIAQLEGQFRNPGVSTALKLATALNVSLETLFQAAKPEEAAPAA